MFITAVCVLFLGWVRDHGSVQTGGGGGWVRDHGSVQTGGGDG